MLILYAAMRHDYGKPEQGTSFEHNNFFDSLRKMGHDILYFDTMELMGLHGRERMNRRLEEVARSERPDLLFSVLFRDELDPATVRRISMETDTTTVNWFCDDHWRFDDFSRRWAGQFNWAVTTCASALPGYERHGLRNVIKSQWACNHFLYRKLDLPLARDITFIGQPHGDRRAVIGALREAGLKVDVWGQGWESGRLSQEGMIEVFNQSRINLNLANASQAPPTRGQRLRSGGRQAVASLLGRVPGGRQVKVVAKRLLDAAPQAAVASAPAVPSQIKGRNFEVPGCGGLLLTDTAENLEDYFEPGREVATFTTVSDLIDRARHFLAHEEERAAIARAGHERTLREHTYVHRFAEIFRRAGLPGGSIDEQLAGRTAAGHVVDIG